MLSAHSPGSAAEWNSAGKARERADGEVKISSLERRGNGLEKRHERGPGTVAQQQSSDLLSECRRRGECGLRQNSEKIAEKTPRFGQRRLSADFRSLINSGQVNRKRKTTRRHIGIKLLKTKDKEDTSKAEREATSYPKGEHHSKDGGFLTEAGPEAQAHFSSWRQGCARRTPRSGRTASGRRRSGGSQMKENLENVLLADLP